MKQFNIVVEEILRRVVTEEAENLLDAIDAVETKYDEQEIVLDYEDLISTDFKENGEFSTENTFYTYYGKSVLLEGNKELALIKTMNKYAKDYNYIVAKGLTYNAESDLFNWKEETHFTNILEAIEYFDEQQENKIEKDYIKEKKDLPTNQKIHIYDMLLDDLFENNHYTEALEMLHNYGFTNEELAVITSSTPEEIEDMLSDEEEQDIE